MGLEGDDRKIANLIRRLKKADGAFDDAVKATEAASLEEYQADFHKGVDPWGEAWAPRKDGKAGLVGTGRPLQGTGELFNAASSSAGDSVKIEPSYYWVFHQVGANNMHRRAVLPFGTVSNWNPPIQAKIERVVLGLLSGDED